MKVGSVAYRRFALSLAAVLAGVGLFGLTACDETLDQAAAVTGTTEVEVHDNVFEPRVIEVQAGTEVTWTWVGDRYHNVGGERFQSTVQAEGEFAHRFDRTGSFDYVCTLHGGMTGRVTVVP